MSGPRSAHWAEAIDWAQPWLRPYRPLGESVARRAMGGRALHHALNTAVLDAGVNAGRPPVRFVPQHELPAGEAYEHHIARTAECPTREGLHDFFNGIVWQHWPQSKQRLSALQAAEISRHGIGPQRGALRDALTLFDENGALLMAPRDMWNALRTRDWKTLFVTQRSAWVEARLLIFGHALLAKLTKPRKAITAHVLQVPDAFNSIADADAWVAAALSGSTFASKPFSPLPVLGVPGWCSGNEDDCFYDDLSVFRPRAAPMAGNHKALSGLA